MNNNQIIRKIIPFAELLSMGLSFINTLIIMNTLSIEGYATYSYIITIVMWAAVFMDLGISNMIFTKGLTNQIEELDSYLTARSINSIVVILILSVFFFIRKPELLIVGSVYGIIIFLNSTSNLFKNLARSQEYSKEDLFIIFSENILRLTLLILIFIVTSRGNGKLEIIILSLLIAGTIAIIFNYIKLHKKIPLRVHISDKKFIIKALKTSFSEAKYFIFYFFLIALLGRIEIVFLEKYTMNHQLGIYATARNLLDFIQLFLASIIMSRYREFNLEPFKMFSMLIGFCLVVIFSTQLLSQWGFKILFPKDYESGYRVLNILIFSIIPYTIYTFLITYFNVNKLTYYNTYLLLIPIIIKIVIYNFAKSSNLEFYSFTFTIIEYITLVSFITLYFLRNNLILKKQ